MTTAAQLRSDRVKAHAKALGFDLVGVAPTSVPAAFARYQSQMDAGFGAEMGWLKDNPQMRRDVREVWPAAKSVVVVAMSYAPGPADGIDGPSSLSVPLAADEGWISRYAQGRDYHLVVRKRLIQLVRLFSEDPELGFDSREHRVFTDTGPVLEKAFAQAAGIGWQGKNTLLIHKYGGSWYFLGVVLTPLELAVDTPATDHCGSCTQCLDICPTDAFARPYVLDARKCIATWTIETEAPREVISAKQLGQHVFGCDLCQEVCPWNRRAQATTHPQLAPRPDNIRPKLAELRALDEAAFRARFPKSPVRRVKAAQMHQVIDAITGRGEPE